MMGFTVSVDLEYEVRDEAALRAAGSKPEYRPGKDSEAADRIAQLLERKIDEGALDLPGAKVVGRSLTLPG